MPSASGQSCKKEDRLGGSGDAPLAGRLEKEPLDERVAVLLVRDGQPLLVVVAVDEVEHYRVRLPDHEVAVVVVDERGDAPVGAVLGELGGLLLALLEDEVDGLVREPELFQDKCDLPTERNAYFRQGVGGRIGRQRGGTHQPLVPPAWV